MRSRPPYGSLRWYYLEKVPLWAKLLPLPLCMSGSGVVKLLEAYGYELGAGWEIAIHLIGFWGAPIFTVFLLLKIYAKESFKVLPSESLLSRGRGFQLSRSGFPNHRSLMLQSPIFLGIVALILVVFVILTFTILTLF